MRAAGYKAALSLIAVCAVVMGVRSGAQSTEAKAASRTLPVWAYPVLPAPAGAAAAPGVSPQHVAGSAAAYTEAEIQDLFVVPDWFP
ncbi:MAG TPA: hypothetical protein VIM60_04670, partial [Edaphobacter sp.]